MCCRTLILLLLPKLKYSDSSAEENAFDDDSIGEVNQQNDNCKDNEVFQFPTAEENKDGQQLSDESEEEEKEEDSEDEHQQVMIQELTFTIMI
jgi:hypothetical protein